MESTLMANIYAAEMAIEYLKEQGTYDLRDLGSDRFQTLIELITKNYHEKFQELEKELLDIPL